MRRWYSIQIILLFASIAISSSFSIGQTIQMVKEDGVYKIPCKLNGVPMTFILDTGASNVVISITEASFMLKNGYLKEADFIGIEKYKIANGEFAEGTKVMLKSIQIGHLFLYNVEASILHSRNSPLLLGLSLLERLGNIEIDNERALLKVTKQNQRNFGDFGGFDSNADFGYGAVLTKEVSIGNQIWSRRDLNVEYFSNGDQINQAKTNNDWKKASSNKNPAWCYYDNDSLDKDFGKLYNWYAVIDPRGLCPAGWHVATGKDWMELENIVGSNPGDNIKGYSQWLNNGWGSDTHNFSALPGGFRTDTGNFEMKGIIGSWWTSTEYNKNFASSRYLTSGSKDIESWSIDKGYGFSVRCVKN